MAILFELVVNFGANDNGVDAATEVVLATGHIEVRGGTVPLCSPYITRLPTYIEFTVVAHGMGFGGPGPKPNFDPRSLTGEEITQVGRALYGLLRSFSGYRAAIVGWDPESLVDLEDLESDWRGGDPPNYNGLVLTREQCQEWQLGSDWVGFDGGHLWLPYAGSRNVWD